MQLIVYNVCKKQRNILDVSSLDLKMLKGNFLADATNETSFFYAILLYYFTNGKNYNILILELI